MKFQSIIHFLMVFLLTPDDFLAQRENPQSKWIMICQSRDNNSLNMIYFYIELRLFVFLEPSSNLGFGKFNEYFLSINDL